MLITPVRDEAHHLPALIESVQTQSLLPVEWIIVDDGSSDETVNVVITAVNRVPWIRLVRTTDRGKRSVGAGVVEAFYAGFEALQTSDWEYICKLDGDLKLPPRYFQRLVSYFDRDHLLGAASGKLFLERKDGRPEEEPNSDEAVWGCANFYRRACFEAVGGFDRVIMWDGIVFHRARMEGWRTRSIRDPELCIIEQRAMGASDGNVLKGRRRWGLGQYVMGTHPLFVLAIGAYRALQRPFLLGGLSILIGYVGAFLRGLERYCHPGFQKSLHAWQFERLGIGRRLEELPPPPPGLYPGK